MQRVRSPAQARSARRLREGDTHTLEGRAAPERQGERPISWRLNTRRQDVLRTARKRDALAAIGAATNEQGGAQCQRAAKAERAE